MENYFRIFGVISRQDAQKGIPGLRVQVLDKDLFFDSHPDIYLKIIDADGTELFTTEDKVRYEAGLGYLFTPVVYNRALLKGEVFAPRLIDSVASMTGGVSGWINPIDGVMPPYLHLQLYREI